MSDWILYVLIYFGVGLGILIHDEFSSRHDAKNAFQREQDSIFKLKEEALIQQLTIAEIELANMIVDPLEAVPAISFGHIHSVWGYAIRKNDQIELPTVFRLPSG